MREAVRQVCRRAGVQESRCAGEQVCRRAGGRCARKRETGAGGGAAGEERRRTCVNGGLVLQPLEQIVERLHRHALALVFGVDVARVKEFGVGPGEALRPPLLAGVEESRGAAEELQVTHDRLGDV